MSRGSEAKFLENLMEALKLDGTVEETYDLDYPEELVGITIRWPRTSIWKDGFGTFKIRRLRKRVDETAAEMLGPNCQLAVLDWARN